MLFKILKSEKIAQKLFLNLLKKLVFVHFVETFYERELQK